MGGGNDQLNARVGDPAAKQDLDLSGIRVFNGGDGEDTATLTGFDEDYVEGGLFNRVFNSWESVTVDDTLLSLEGENTITTLTLQNESTLYQTEDVVILDEDGNDNAKVVQDDTSTITMQDADAPMSPMAMAMSFMAPLSHTGIASTTITSAEYEVTGKADPKVNTSLKVDFDADDVVNQDPRDNASSGNADQYDVTKQITRNGIVGIDINTVGGYLNSGLPLSLAGSVNIIDDLQAPALANPGIGATLVASTGYVTDDLFVDPAREWALVDQGENGVYLQWTTPINPTTTGPNVQADVSAAMATGEVVDGILSGIVNGTVLRRNICLQPVADAPTAYCDPTHFTVWLQGGGAHASFGSVDDFDEFDVGTAYGVMGLEYAFDEDWRAGVFAGYGYSDVDLGSIEGAFGERSSDAEISGYYAGGYLDANFDHMYFTVIGLYGLGHSEVHNGVLLDAESDYNSNAWAIGGTIGGVIPLNDSGLAIDPRLQAYYVSTDTDDYEDSYGLGLQSGTDHARVAATVGFVYEPADAIFSMALRAGGAYVSYDTTLDASDDFSKSSASVNRLQEEFVGTGSFDAAWKMTDNATLIGTFGGDIGQDLEVYRGSLTFSYTFD